MVGPPGAGSTETPLTSRLACRPQANDSSSRPQDSPCIGARAGGKEDGTPNEVIRHICTLNDRANGQERPTAGWRSFYSSSPAR
eukprot:scaffold246337_cov35-Tisochrysis_lutea.AAC.6